ncbi:hypothetical protein LGV61_10845 [Desulfurispirillum indicum]|uniref:Cytochrome c7-like domain-containing protein n=1 Tax=Desulfurispirillum indicum (strain ATCC BAA-1389 / DSM 22839 / S5) TaxID=653733 RepID=E6W3L5_DESIS|nr:hypothetical protein [Desulfurispirillum indicum]ADU66896.1 hypothetical protein Selin_2176 [Desulfurispirillum indicum S5]UCZ56213.1 hypothetical protein LGV61_10845 [Desulfurispirillum indicum]
MIKKLIPLLLSVAFILIAFSSASAIVKYRGDGPYKVKAHPDEFVAMQACSSCHQTGWPPELPPYGPRIHELQRQGIETQEAQGHIHGNFGFTSCVVCHTNIHNAETASESLTGGSIKSLAASCVGCHGEGGFGGYWGDWTSEKLRPHTFKRAQ